MVKVDFSQGRAVGTICEHNSKGQYRMCWAVDQSVKLSDWCNSYVEARKQAIKSWRKHPGR